MLDDAVYYQLIQGSLVNYLLIENPINQYFGLIQKNWRLHLHYPEAGGESLEYETVSLHNSAFSKGNVELTHGGP